MRYMKDMGISHEITNVNGGAIAMGHPLGATGAMILGTLIDELERREQRYGLATLCVGGGMGIATIVERIWTVSNQTAASDQQKAVRWEKGADGIAIVTLDDPSSSANTMNDAYKAAMGEVVDQLVAAKDELTGVIITSAKKTFFAGGNLEQLSSAGPDDAPAVFESVTEVKAQLRRLETLGRPVVAAMNGTALGGGLEIGLACHHRIGLDARGVIYGLPEVTLGLLPGGGGVTRITRMLGIANGFMNVLAQGQRMKPDKALEVGIIDELASTPEEMLE